MPNTSRVEWDASCKWWQLRAYWLRVILVLSLIPNPIFDVAGIAAGALGLGWGRFLLVTAVGKTLRAIVIAYAGAFAL